MCVCVGGGGGGGGWGRKRQIKEGRERSKYRGGRSPGWQPGMSYMLDLEGQSQQPPYTPHGNPIFELLHPVCEVLVFHISSHILYEYYVTIPLNRKHVLTVSTELNAEKGKDEGMRKKVQYEAKTESNGCFYSCRHLFLLL